jgi:hypothetical protein
LALELFREVDAGERAGGATQAGRDLKFEVTAIERWICEQEGAMAAVRKMRRRAKFWQRHDGREPAPLTAAGKARRKLWLADWRAKLAQLAHVEQEARIWQR